MLALTKKTDYALIALSHLAKRPEGVVSAREIAEASGVPLPILTNILKTLTNAGIVISARGAYGGYGLARPTEAISLHELITVIEGSFHLVQCMLAAAHPNKNPCELEPSCPIRHPASKLHGRLKEFLENVSLAEVVYEDQGPLAGRPAEMEAPSLRQTAVRELTE